MSNPLRAASGDARRRARSRSVGSYSGRAAEPTEDDPLFVQALGFLQQAQWREALAILTALERRYPGSLELARMRQVLALRLSAEETWASTAGHRFAVALRRPAVRALMIANLVVYGLLGVVWLFGEVSGLLR